MQLSEMPLRKADYWIVAVGSMEQVIGAALSSVIGVMLPMIQLILHPPMSSFLQGMVGAMGLIGIGIGGVVIGKISDEIGYLFTFRLCPILMIVGTLICFFLTSIPWLIVGLLIIGIGVGGGYSLDSAYISELLPKKWSLFMVGLAKATCALGFIGGAVVCYFILRADPNPHIWNYMILSIGGMGVITLLMRLHWAESPKWLLMKGENAKALKAAQFFLGPDVQLDACTLSGSQNIQKQHFSVKANWDKIIFSGIPWACEGLAVYGFSVFLPVLVMALGLESSADHGIHKVMNSVEISALVNFFILPGFIIGLLVVRKVNNVRLMNRGFLLSAVGLLLLLASFLLKWPAGVMVIGFIIFEVSLNAGPHLVTYIIPASVYPVAIRAEGQGIASMIGKVGAVLGVILMPVLLSWGGMTLVLIVSAGVMLLGAAIGRFYGRKLKMM